MVHSRKHYVQTTLSTITTGAKLDIVVVKAVEDTSANLGNEVAEGSTIKAVYFEMWVIGTVTDQFFTAVIVKLPGGLGGPTVSNLADLNTWDNKKNILYTTQGLASNDGIAMPLPLFKGWIKIPKGKQRFGLGDKLQFVIMSRGDASLKVCGFNTYKEYT